MTVDYFRHILIDAFGAVEGLSSGMKNRGVTAHGLRFTAATRLRELGCSWEDIAAITGHDTAEMIEHYTEQKCKAKLAIGRLDAATAAAPEQNQTETVKLGLEK